MNEETNPADPRKYRMFAKILLSAFSLAFFLCVVLAVAWFRERRQLDLDKLRPDQIQVLMNEVMKNSPGVLQQAGFEPRIGYTLKPSAELTCWGDTFVSNELGYRTGPAKKGDDVFRVVFLGDSWAYGMGVSEAESFPKQFEALANQFAGQAGRIEAWNLSLPGYNTHNELAALECFFDEIRPDAVVLCPTSNDIDSTHAISPAGTLAATHTEDPYFRVMGRLWDSHLFRRLWHEAFSAVRETEIRLSREPVRLFLVFLAGWPEALPHYLVSQGAIEAPYAILPRTYSTSARWRNPREKFGHGTAEAQGVFAKVVYRLVAGKLGWKPLPRDQQAGPGSEVAVHHTVPPGDWAAKATEVLRDQPRLPEEFSPRSSKEAARQCFGRLVFWPNGAMSHSAAICLAKKAGATRAKVTLMRVRRAKLLYPMEVQISIPSPGGGARVTATLTRDGPEFQTVVLPIPVDIEDGTVLDVMVMAPRASFLNRRNAFYSRSLHIWRIEQE